MNVAAPAVARVPEVADGLYTWSLGPVSYWSFAPIAPVGIYKIFISFSLPPSRTLMLFGRILISEISAR
ncbi:hypothetical protein GGD50_003039 [Rhizobium paranaense]|uniref:Uncharacterized protein n=1 Tax=Rhizobium paranaense TaxID=1650438 RepID=A0A7W9D1L4_9HYPH|nr:hypothetical protein [Rhizobium paranaense]